MILFVPILIFVSLTVVDNSIAATLNSEDHEFIYAKCEPDRQSCRDCYFTLVKSLLGRADNVFNLVSAFSPVGQYEPEYVIITYTFRNYTLDRDKTWFWSKSNAYYLFSMNVLQKLSFFLSKDSEKYQQHASVTLNATDCWGVSNEYMMLLTQRLHAHVQSQSITPHLDHLHSALAVNEETIDQVINGGVALVANIILVCPIVAIILVLIVIVMLLVVYIKRDQWKEKSPLTISTKAALASLAFTNASYCMLVYVMDINAVIGRTQLYSIHSPDKVGTPYNILYNIPVVVMVIDLVATVPSGVLARQFYTNIHNIKDSHYYYLVLSIIGVIVSLLNHAPYMMMAYFIDAYYATGVLMSHIVITLSLFTLLEFTFDSWLRKKHCARPNNKWLHCKRLCGYSLLILILIVSYIGLVYTVVLYLIEIPIKPVFVAIGSYAMYKIASNRKRLWKSKCDDKQSQPQSDEGQVQDESHVQDTEQQPLLTVE